MDQPLAERMLRALLIQMLRTDAIDPDDLSAAADELTAQGDDEAAHAIKCLIVESMSPSQTDWQADQRRSRLHLVAPDDGKPTP